MYKNIQLGVSVFRFGSVPDNFEMDDVMCIGSENRIEDCPHKDTDNCAVSEGAGVVCINKGKYKTQKRTLELLFTSLHILKCSKYSIQYYL